MLTYTKVAASVTTKQMTVSTWTSTQNKCMINSFFSLGNSNIEIYFIFIVLFCRNIGMTTWDGKIDKNKNWNAILFKRNLSNKMTRLRLAVMAI